MLSLSEKRTILNSFSELRERKDTRGRYFYYFDNAKAKRRRVAHELDENGNGYVYGGDLLELKHLWYKDKAICIKNFSESELREIVKKVILSLS